MDLLVWLLFLAVPAAGWLAWDRYRRWRIRRRRRQIRRQVIAADLAGRRTALRISAAEHQAIQHLLAEADGRFAKHTQSQPEAWW